MDISTAPLGAPPSRVLTLYRSLRWASPPLAAVGALMLALAGASLVGMLVDPRVVTGAPAWLKPFKFAVSTSVYSLTLAWVFTMLPGWPRMRSIVGWITAVVFVLEVAIIDFQAWRGTMSHFNGATPLDRTLYSVMGAAIFLQTLASVTVAVALWRERFADRALGWALRLGMTMTILGAMTGPLMTRPTPDQLARARAGEPMTVVGAHTVGAPDGGPGMPVTGWSREHGDVRVPHFVGLHAIQVLALFGLALRRRGRTGAVGVRMVLVGAASYALLFALVLVEALSGRSVVSASGLTALAAWAALTSVALVLAGSRTAGARGEALEGRAA